MMYTVATHLIETATGTSFNTFLQDHFFTPLGMSSSYLQPHELVLDRIPNGHMWDSDHETLKSIRLVPAPESQGAGSIFTTAKDYCKYIKALMNNEPPFNTEIQKDLTRARIICNPDGSSNEDGLAPYTSWDTYAAGWEVRYYRGVKIVQHYGLNYGFGSTHFFVPHFKFGGMIVGNAADANDVAGILSSELIDETLGVAKAERPDWNQIGKDATAKYEKDNEESEEKLRKELCSADSGPEAQEKPLSAYTGLYHNAGYHDMRLEVKDNELFADMSDRSMGYYLRFEHMSGQTKYLVHFSDFLEAGDELMEGEFKFVGDKVVSVGVKLEEDLDDLIWFDRVDEDLSVR
jgi:hypothetical protein